MSGERLIGCGNNLVVRHVAQVLANVPPVPERILELTVQVTPKHVGQGLADRRPGRDSLREHASASATSRPSTTAVPPIVVGERIPISGNSSATCSEPSPTRSSTDIKRPSARGIRLTSSAPNAVR